MSALSSLSLSDDTSAKRFKPNIPDSAFIDLTNDDDDDLEETPNNTKESLGNDNDDDDDDDDVMITGFRELSRPPTSLSMAQPNNRNLNGPPPAVASSNVANANFRSYANTSLPEARRLMSLNGNGNGNSLNHPQNPLVRPKSTSTAGPIQSNDPWRRSPSTYVVPSLEDLKNENFDISHMIGTDFHLITHAERIARINGLGLSDPAREILLNKFGLIPPAPRQLDLLNPQQRAQQSFEQRRRELLERQRQHQHQHQHQHQRPLPTINNPAPASRKFVKWNNIAFKSIKEVDAKERAFKESLNRSQAEQAAHNQKKLKNTSLMKRVLEAQANLEKAGIAKTTAQFLDLTKSQHELSMNIKKDVQNSNIIDKRIKDDTRNLLNFSNTVKPQLIANLNKIQMEREAQERSEQRLQQGGNAPLSNIPGGVFGDMLQTLNPQRHQLHIDTDDEEGDDDDEFPYHMFANRNNNLNPYGPPYGQAGDDDDMYQRPNLYTDNPDDLRSFLESFKTIEADIEGESNTPDALTVNLMKHQRMGLHWLEMNEDDPKKKGGILADAMGLGKTIQAISVMLSRRSDDEMCKTNLIVCPVAMMRQWESEINTKIKESAGFKVMVYHPSSNGKRFTNYKQLAKYDAVLISYQTLASEMKKHIHGYDIKAAGLPRINTQKESDKNTYWSPFFSQDSIFHRVILDEAHWIKNKLAKNSIACWLLKAKSRWCLTGTPMQNNFEEIFPLIRFLNIRPYCFEERFRVDISIPLKSKNGNYDEMDREKSMKRLRVLIKAILLRRTKDSEVDGQPILSLPPKEVIYDEVIIEDDNNESSFYRHLEGKSQLEVERLMNSDKGFAKGNYSSILTLLLRLRQACLHSELVRIGDRKQGIVYDDDGNVKASATWEMMFDFCKSLKPEIVRRINNQEQGVQNGGDDGEDENGGRFTCSICLDTPPDEEWTMFYPCGHGLCKECIGDFFEKFQTGEKQGVKIASCTQCRMEIRENQIFTFQIFNDVVNKKLSKSVMSIMHEKAKKEMAKVNDQIRDEIKKLGLSPKFKRALELIEKITSENPNEKIILFSQFTTLFDVFEKFLRDKQIPSLRYDGSMKSDDRNDVIKDFYKLPDKRLLLISLKAGNVGLTLTCANHVIIMDPFWNPYVEEQAQDRAHRIGQEKAVKVYRLLTKGTVEDRIMELQKQKKELIEGALDEQGMKSAGGLSRNEIMYLFALNDRPR